MDPVSRMLREREERLPRLTPWVILAVVLHGLAVAAALWARRIEPARPAHLPAVSVRLVRPNLLPGRRPGRTTQAQAPKTEPKPQPAPPKPAAEPKTAPAPRTAPPASDNAMRSAEPDTTPVPEPVAPAAAETAANDAGTKDQAPPGPPSGLSLGDSSGGGGGGGTPAIPSDFQFTYYVDRMLALIESKWYKPPVPAGTHAQVRFTITNSGRLEGIELESDSGVPSFDRAVLRALYAVNPLPPLPPAYRKPSLTVHLTFAE